MNKPLAIAYKPFKSMKMNTSKERSFYTQGQQFVARVLFILWLLASGSPEGILAVPKHQMMPATTNSPGDPSLSSALPTTPPGSILQLPADPPGAFWGDSGASTPAMESTFQQRMSQEAVPFRERDLLRTSPKVSPVGEHLSFEARGGESVRFTYQRDQWRAEVSSHIGAFSRRAVLPVVCSQGEDVASSLEALSKYPSWQRQRQIHVLDRSVCPTLGEVVYVGKLGLKGGGQGQSSARGKPGDPAPSGSQIPTAASTSQQEVEPPLVKELRALASDPQIDQQPDKLAELGTLLLQLAASKQEAGTSSQDLSLYTEAAILYQHVLSICEQKEDKIGKQKVRKLSNASYRGLSELQASMLTRAKGATPIRVEEVKARINADKQRLEAIRTKAREEAERLSEFRDKQGSAEEVLAAEGVYIEDSKKLFAEIATEIKSVLGDFYQAGEEELKAVGIACPCKYAIMGVGSIALQQTTPYSDLEFAILMEDAPGEDTAEAWRVYFRKLTHLVHFRVINLGETVLPFSEYKISLDHLGRKGLNFDLGGKTPLGRKDKDYELIQPVEGMMEYLKNEGNKMEQMDKLLPFVLERTCYIYGAQGLHDRYLASQKAFWSSCQDAAGKHAYQERMRKVLLEGITELDHSQPGVVKAGRKQAANLRTVGPKLHPDDTGRLYDVKQEIYRLPDRLLYGLATYYGLRPESGWDAVEQLKAQGIIGVSEEAKQAAHRLQYAVSFATMLRLATYIRYGQQKETLAGSASSEQTVSELFALPKEALQENGSLFKYYYTALALHSEMEEFFELLNLRLQIQTNRVLCRSITAFRSGGKYTAGKEKAHFHSLGFYDTSCATKIAIYNRLLHYEEAAKCAEEDFKKVKAGYNQKKLARYHHNLGVTYYHLGKFAQSFDHFENSLRYLKELYPDGDPQIATVLRSLGIAHYNLSEFQESLKHFKDSLEMLQGLYQENNPETAQALVSVGAAYEQIGNFEESLQYKQQALRMLQALYPEKDPEVARALLRLGDAYAAMDQLETSLDHKEQSLKMFKALYGKSHPQVARALLSLGDVHAALENFEASLKHKGESLEMFRALYGSSHPEVARALLSLGEMYALSGKLQESADLKEQSWKMLQAFYREDHPEVIRALSSLSETRGSLIEDAESSKQDPGHTLRPLRTAYPQHLALLPTPRHGKEPAGENTKLQEYYQNDNFACVKSLFNEQDSKHVTNTQCQLMLREQKLVEEDKDKREDTQDKAEAEDSMQENQIASYHARLKEVTIPIRLEDLFKDRSVKPGEPTKAVQRILLTGDPGTGKTTVSKKLAYQWAKGAWGQEFHSLYLLPVRSLPEKEYDGMRYNREKTLATAIVNNCFTHPPSDEDEYKQLRRHIEEELEKPTTLVILDGLDERAGASKKILSQAQDQSAPHKLLMLSRPYGIEIERRLANIEIDHRGFNDDQLEAYVREELPDRKLAEELLDYIQKHANIREVAHIPVNLQILCALWQDESYGVKKEELQQDSPASLYRLFTEFIWKRYTKKWQLEENEEALFDTLGQIALAALEKGEVLISPGLVHQYAKQDKLEARLKDAGFLLLRSIDQKFYQFPHLTFQEYFAGRLLAVRFLGDEDARERCKGFVENYKYNSSYRQTLSFFSGELSNQLSKSSSKHRCDQLSNLLELLDSEPKEVVGLQHALLQASMLHEWLCLAGQEEQDDLVSVGSQVVDSLQESYLSQGQRAVDQLMGDYWTSKDPKLVLYIIGKLHQTPLVIRPSHRRGYKEAVLYLEGGDKPWRRSSKEKEIAQFTDLLTGELAKDCKTLHAYSDGDLRKAMSYLERYLAIYEQLYATDPNQPDMARTLRSLGIVYGHLDNYTQALEYYKRALQVQQGLHKEENHAEVATDLRNVGLAYRRLGKYTESLEYYQQALTMRKALHEGENHDEVAQSLNDVGVAYGRLDKYIEALEYYQQALTMRKALHEGENHAQVATDLRNVGLAYYNLGKYTEALEYHQQALQMQQALHEGEKHADVARNLRSVGLAYRNLSNYTQALEYYQQVLQMHQALHEGENHADVALVLNDVGVAHQNLGNHAQALEYYQQALQMYQALHEGENHAGVARNLRNVAIAYENLGNYAQSLEYYQQALTMQKALHEENHAQVAVNLRSVGIAYHNLGNHAQALEYHQQALQMQQALHEENHAQVAVNLRSVGIAYHNLGNHAQALEYYQQALQMQQALHEGENHADVAGALSDVGGVYENLDNYTEALEYYQQALRMQQALHEEDHAEEVAQALSNVGDAYQGLDNYTEALEYHQQALTMQKALHEGENHDNVAGALSDVGRAYQGLGQHEQALEYYQQALRMQQALHEEDHAEEVAQALSNVGDAYQGLDNYTEALEYHQQALTMQKALHEGENHDNVAGALSDVGRAYQGLGQHEQALEYYQQALTMQKALHGGVLTIYWHINFILIEKQKQGIMQHLPRF